MREAAIKKLEVLKDTKLLVENQYVKPSSGVLMILDKNIRDKFEDHHNIITAVKESYKDVFANACQVCVRGAILFSILLKKDEKYGKLQSTHLNSDLTYDDTLDCIQGVFTKKELTILELFFEGNVMSWTERILNNDDLTIA